MSSAKENDGTCCSCGDVAAVAGQEETKCSTREDEFHCVHWWEGHPDDPDKVPLT